jgi:PadR family transcriptional regulator AphA
MQITKEELDGIGFLAGEPGNILLSNEADAIELLELCGNNGVRRILLVADNLAESFFDLRTCVAGNVLQKFSTYRIRAAAVIARERVGDGRFGEMAFEAAHGGDFRVFDDRESAVRWLVRE